MPRHQDADTSFETPQAWVDKTIVAHAFGGDKKGEASPNFVMTKDVMRDDDSLRGHVDRQMLELGRHLKDFDLLEIKETQLGGLPAVCMRYTWSGHFGRLEQTITVVERILNNLRVAVSFTTTAPAQDAAAARPLFDTMLKSVRFGGPRSPSGTPSPARAPSAPPPAFGEGEAPFIPMPGYRGDRR